MLRACLRDLRRQPARTGLTVAGIVIGIFTLTVLGAMAEHFRAFVDDARGYVAGTIRLMTKTNAQGENPGVTAEDFAAIGSLANVAAVGPAHTLFFDGFDLEADPLQFLSPKPLVEGLEPKLAKRMRPGVRLVAGRWLEPGDDGKHRVMVVSWLAARRSVKVGDTTKLRRKDYEIVGIYDAPDLPVVPAGIVPFSTLRRDFERPMIQRAQQFLGAQRAQLGLGGATGKDDLAAVARRFVEEQEERYYLHEVVPHDTSPAAVDALAAELRRSCPHVAVIDPASLVAQVEKAVAIFIAITAVVSVISSVVGGLLIVNTMAMAVVERRREIAIKVAVGASAGQVAAEFVVEATLLSLSGTAVGLTLGAAAAAILDPWIVARLDAGQSLFKVTPGLLLSVTAYGLVLGVVAGAFPAARAARAEPARGLREL